jgi:hypothetical protein
MAPKVSVSMRVSAMTGSKWLQPARDPDQGRPRHGHLAYMTSRMEAGNLKVLSRTVIEG